MITNDTIKNQGDDVKGFIGLSTDDKPIDKINGITLKNGMYFYEMDTCDVYMFSETTREWIVQD